MKTALETWMESNKDAMEETKSKKENQGKKIRKLGDGETIVRVNEVVTITDAIFQFKNTGKDGKEQATSVQRFFYWFNPVSEYVDGEEDTYPLMIPKSVHYEILDLAKEYKNLDAVKIKRLGTGKETEYKVFPQLKGN